jgi:hypothetical protein
MQIRVSAEGKTGSLSIHTMSEVCRKVWIVVIGIISDLKSIMASLHKHSKSFVYSGIL